jgi:porin
MPPRVPALAPIVVALLCLGATGVALAADGGPSPAEPEPEESPGAGVSLSLGYVGEAFANLSGGLRRGGAYDGRLELAADLDLERLVGWTGATVHANAYQIHGRSVTAEQVGSLMPVSNIEALPATRLFTLWLEQALFDDRFSVRIGQLAADDEFFISQTGTNFMNGTFGWAALPAADMTDGGPAYPLAAPGLRLRVEATQRLTILAAVFSGDPAGGPGPGDPQERNPSGTTFSFQGGAFSMVEAQYGVNQGPHAAGLPGVYKLGALYHSGTFDDQHFDNQGRSLASPFSTGVPHRHRGDFAVYGVADQMVWREQGTEAEGLNLFLRVGGAPFDRNLIGFYADGGAAYRGLIPGRGTDVLGLAVGYAEIGDSAREFDRDTRAFSGIKGPVRGHEVAIELTYVAEIMPGWTIQPDLQYVFNPGGNVPDPSDPSGQRAIRDSLVLGVRTTVSGLDWRPF